MSITTWGAVAVAAASLVFTNTGAFAHGFAGERFFPATILTDDPFVADEMSLPQVSLEPPGPDNSQQTNFLFDLSKRITPSFDITISDQWQRLRSPGFTSVGGLGPLQTGAQYQLFVDGPHQALGLLGLNVTWGHTGSSAVSAPNFTTLSPTFDFGKGFGDIPRSLPWLRPFAITGNLGFDFPTQATTAGVPNPNNFTSWMPYTSPFNLTKNPSCSIPCGFADGLPIGLMVTGPLYEDLGVLQACQAYEEAAGPIWPSPELSGCLDKIARPADAAVKAKIPASRSL